MAKLTHAERHRAALRYGKGETARSIAAELGVSHVAIVRLAARRGITPPKRRTVGQTFHQWLGTIRA